MSNAAGCNETEVLRIKYAFWLAVTGLLIAAVLAIFLVFRAEMKDVKSADVVAIVGLFTSVIGTLVGAFFGIQIGAAGTEQERKSRRDAEQDRRQAEGIARIAMGHLTPEVASQVMQMMDRVG
jgi:hypothetical protein